MSRLQESAMGLTDRFLPMRRYSGFLFIYSPLGGGLYSSVIHTKCVMNAEPNFFF